MPNSRPRHTLNFLLPFRCSPPLFSLLHPLVFALSLCPTLASLFAGEVYVPFCCSPLPFSLRHPFVFAFCHPFSLCPTLTSLFAGEVHMFFAVHHFPFRCDTRSCSLCVAPSRCAQLSLHFSPVKFTLYLLIFANRLFFLLRPTRFPLYSSSITSFSLYPFMVTSLCL